MSIADQGRLSRQQMLHLQPKPFGDAAPIRRVRFQEVPNLPFLNGFRHRLHAPDDVADQPLLRIRLQQAEEISRLLVVVLAQVMIVAIDGPGDRPRALPYSGFSTGPQKLLADARIYSLGAFRRTRRIAKSVCPWSKGGG